ncbi:MAG: POTRA domain-containing protein [Acidithiobacillales bacterium]
MRWRHPVLPPLAAALIIIPSAGAAARQDDLYGGRIASLAFEGDSTPQTAAWSRLTDLKPGQTLTPGAVRSAIRDLFATRQFLDLAVEASQDAGGISVVIRFAAVPRIRTFEVVGKKIPEKAAMREAIGLWPGDLWQPDAGGTLAVAIRAHLRAYGRFEAKVSLDVTAEEGVDAVDVRVGIDPGPAALSAPPEFVGSLGEFPESRLRKETRQKPGKEYREARARADADRYETLLREKGYGRAEVRWLGASFDEKALRVTCRYRVFAGPRTVLRVTGAPVSDVRKHPDSPWARLEPPDEETVLRFRSHLVETYQRKGYAKATVEVSFETSPEEEIVSFIIHKGARYAVGRVALDGTKAVRAGKVRAAVETHPPSLFSRGRLVESELGQDVNRILGVYQGLGFRDAKVATPDVTPGRRPFTLDVDLHVTEGPKYTVVSRSLTGNTKLTEADLTKGLSTRPGHPFTEEGLNADVAALGGRYQEKGFPDARVETTVKVVPGAEPSTAGARVGFSIFEGDQVFFGKTVVRGYRKTKLSVLERELGDREGKPFSLTKTLEMQQRLAALGVFSRAEVVPLPPDPDTGRRTVLVTVTEGKPWSLVYGGGLDYTSATEPKFSPRVSLGASYSNLFGRAIVAGASLLVSRTQNRLRLFAREPSFLNVGLPVTLSVFAGEDFQPGFSVKRGGFYIDTSRKLSATVKTLFRYQYEIVQPSQDPGLGPDQIGNQTNRISSVGPAISWDTRDDPISPTKGFLVTAEMKYAFPFINATANFIRGSLLAAVYRDLFPGSVLAVAVRYGAIQPWGPCDIIGPNPDCKPNLMVPIPERLFAGGRTTHRAFGDNQLGVYGQTVNSDQVGYGGNGFLLFNVEWRQRLVGSLGGAVFFDDGNVWEDWRKVNLGEIRPGAGVGVFFMTPVGPVRLDYGMKLDKKPFETLGVVNFSVGYAF